MTSFGRITVTDLNVWQARSLHVLADLQEAGLKAERYPLNWTVTTNGPLAGEVHRYDPAQTDNDRRAVFDEWVHALGGTQPQEARRFEGGVRLTSVFKVATNRGEVKGSIVVEFEDDDV